jgi:predicted Rossmann-fold nucleotide-binding protein
MLDELFEALTLIQTKKVRAIPIILFVETYWSKAISFDLLVEEGVITPWDHHLIQYA